MGAAASDEVSGIDAEGAGPVGAVAGEPAALILFGRGGEDVATVHRTRLVVNDAVAQVLRNGLGLLGVTAPDRM